MLRIFLLTLIGFAVINGYANDIIESQVPVGDNELRNSIVVNQIDDGESSRMLSAVDDKSIYIADSISSAKRAVKDDLNGPVPFLDDLYDLLSAATLIKVHGSLMVVAWIFAASIGTLIARYFKRTWVNKEFLGMDQWFFWHRCFMMLTWVLTMAGFILIFIEIDGWTNEANPHAIFGVIATAICFFHPILAMCRPEPSHKKRIYFKWGHWFGGTLAYTLAIVAIFLSVSLTEAKLPQWMYWIVAGFVVFHFIMHLVFSALENKTNSHRFYTNRDKDAPYSRWRKLCLGIYIFGTACFTIALVCVICLSPFT